MMRLTCPACAVTLQLKNAVADTSKIKCPRCANVFIVGSSAPPAAISVPQKNPLGVVTEADQRQEAGDARPARLKHQGSRQISGASNLVIGLVVGCLLLGSIGFIVLFLLFGGGNPELSQATYPNNQPPKAVMPLPPEWQVPRDDGKQPTENRKPSKDGQQPRNDGQKTTAASGPEWQPDADLLGRLAMPVLIDDDKYAIRPPEGFVATREAREHAFNGPKRQNGSYCALIIGVYPRGDINDLDKALEVAFATTQRANASEGFQNGTINSKERGRIGGIPFARATFTANAIAKDRALKGFLYVGLDGDAIILMGSRDFADSGDQSLALADCAARTLRKKQSRNARSAS